MAYQADISRSNPGCFLFLIDQSGSMADAFAGGTGHSKADELATIINRLLASLVIRCSKDEGVRDYFDVGVIGYGAMVVHSLAGANGAPFLPISRLADEPLRVEDRVQKIPDGAGGLVEQSVKFPIWIDPAADGGTPMTQAFERGRAALGSWVNGHRRSSHLSCSISLTAKRPTAIRAALPRRCASWPPDDGSALLFNVHLSERRAPTVEFRPPTRRLPDTSRAARSACPVSCRRISGCRTSEGYEVGAGTRGFVFNADATSVIQFLDIGTQPATTR